MDDTTFEVVREAITKLKGELATAKNESADLRDEAQAERTRGEQLTLQLESISAENNDITKQVNELRGQWLSHILTLHETKRKELTLELETVNAENDDLRKQINEFRDLVDELQTEKRQFGDVFRGELRDILS